MTPKRTIISCILIACLITTADAQVPDEALFSKSVRAYLRMPTIGPAHVTVAGGRLATGRIVRVTNKFVAFEEARSRGCQTIPLTSISAITTFRARDSGSYSRRRDIAYFIFLAVALTPIWVPYVLHELLASMSSRGSLAGQWESASKARNGMLDRVSIGQTPTSSVVRETWSMRSGTYATKNGILSLHWEDGTEETMPIRFDCFEIVVGERALYCTRFTKGEVRDPIVGHWSEKLDEVATFEADGTFRMKDKMAQLEGQLNTHGKRSTVTWKSIGGAPPEQWDLHVKHGHLFVGVNGTTTDYRRR